ncbi:MAG: putative molybdenum carrier protein [Planctomycetales bacterium]|nr:putative molybdenum carrier protein [Planctomycetales bacterium]
MGIRKIVSGGQTGVDRGALNAAIAMGIEHGGWCPKGRCAEDGPIDPRYQLRELDSPDYAARTEQNVLDSEGTLILYREKLQGGTLLTHRLAKRHGKPLCRVRLDRPLQLERIVQWIYQHEIQVLNIAGPRGSANPGIEEQACQAVKALLSHPGRLTLSEVDPHGT